MAGRANVTHDYVAVDGGNVNVQVYIRGRPPEDKAEKFEFLDLAPEAGGDTGDPLKKITIRDPNFQVKHTRGDVSFQFDRIFWVDDNQEVVFTNVCKTQVDQILNGYNCCCFAYGQTGSGKTYSMFGAEGGVTIEGETRGMIPRSVEYLFSKLSAESATKEVAMVCSFLEIYCDSIRDLGKAYLVGMGTEEGNSAINSKTSDIFESIAAKRGNPYFAPAFQMKKSESKEKLPDVQQVMDEYQSMDYQIREDSEGNIFVQDLSLIPVSTMDEVKNLISMGLSVRATHETKMNATSSRSHTVFSVTVIQRDKASGLATQGILNLIDLAGSERLKKSESTGLRLKEALHINTSLTALGKVIVALDPKGHNTHIPYRDAKLTRILQNSLGGNSYTTVLAAIHPCATYYEECLSTLQFANRCRNVVNNPRVNYVEDDRDGRIKRLMQEIQTLRMRLKGSGIAEDGEFGAALSPEMIADILTKFGIEANVTEDGRLLVNGEEVDLAEMGFADDGAMGDGGGFGSTSRKGRSGAKDTLIIRELKEHVQELHDKNKVLKKQGEGYVKEIETLTNKLTRALTFAQSMEHKYNDSLDMKKIALSDQESSLRKHYGQQVTDVRLISQQLLEQQMKIMEDIPQNVKEFTDAKKKATTLQKKQDKSLIDHYETEIKIIKANAATTLETYKLQCDHWLDMKNEQIKSFVEQFNNFRVKKNKHLRKCEKELIYLFNHTETLESILDDISKGEFPVRMKQGSTGMLTTGVGGIVTLGADGSPPIMPEMIPKPPSASSRAGSGNEVKRVNNNISATRNTYDKSKNNSQRPHSGGGVVLPKGLRPPNLAHPANLRTHSDHPDHLKLTKKIMSKYAAKEEASYKKKEKLYRDTLLKAEEGGMFGLETSLLDELGNTADDRMVSHIKDFIFNTKRAKERAQSAGIMRSSASTAAARLEATAASKRPATAGVRPNSSNGPEESQVSVTAAVSAEVTEAPKSSSNREQKEKVKFNTELEDAELGIVTDDTEGNTALETGNTNGEEITHLNAGIVTALRTQITALQNAQKKEVMDEQKVVEALGDNKTLQYIYDLEEESRALRTRNRELTAQLKASKIANNALIRKENLKNSKR